MIDMASIPNLSASIAGGGGDPATLSDLAALFRELASASSLGRSRAVRCNETYLNRPGDEKTRPKPTRMMNIARYEAHPYSQFMQNLHELRRVQVRHLGKDGPTPSTLMLSFRMEFAGRAAHS